MAETKTTSLKLWIDSKANRVVFAEADNAFVDFICDILSMPMNSIIKLLIKDNDKGGMVGALANVYRSIEALGNEHIHPNVDKYWVLKPPITACVPLLSLTDEPAYKRISNVPSLSLASTNAKSARANYGYVKEVVKYMVMDNLEVKPLSTALITSQLKNIANSMIEKQVQVGPNEGVAVLKASLETQTVLTAVFLDNKFKTEK